MRLVAAVLATAVLLPVHACRGRGPSQPLQRAADTLYAGADGQALTADYPRVELGGQTRVVAQKAGAYGSTRVHASFEIELGSSPRLELAYGLSPGVQVGTLVTFTTYVVGPEGKSYEHSRDIVVGPDTINRWQEDAIDLDGWSGRAEVELQSYASMVPDNAIHMAAPIVSQRDARRTRPSLLLISLDTLRADHLGVYGYARDTSPHIDRRFGRNGMVVEHAYSQASDTLLGHTAMLLGLYPCAGSAPAGTQSWKLTPQASTLAEQLASAGYRTAAFTEDAMIAGSWGFARGFDLYDEEKSAHATNTALEGTPGFARQTFDRGLDWLKRRDDDPFFLFLHTYEVHAPYTPPASYASLFSTADTDTPTRERNLYDGEIRYLDAELDRLLVELERLGLDDNTYVVVTSDHGEEFAEHGGRYHSSQVYDEVLRVPLLITGPGLPAGGVRRSGPVALIDLLPTLLDLLGVARTTAPLPPHGMSVANHLKTGAQLDERTLFAEARGLLRWTYDGFDKDWLRPTYAALRWPAKLIRQRTAEGPSYALYDLDGDPAERDDRLSESPRPDGAEALIAEVERYAADCEAQQAALRQMFTADAGSIDADREEKLRALGYIE